MELYESMIETIADFLKYEKEQQFQEEQKCFYDWLDEIHDNRLLSCERYVCPFCGNIETSAVFKENVKTKYVLWCSRCKRTIRKLTKEEVDVLPKPQYGVWNGIQKRFVFGIRESSSELAWAKFKKKCSGWRKWRYEVKQIPLKKLLERIVKEKLKNEEI